MYNEQLKTNNTYKWLDNVKSILILLNVVLVLFGEHKVVMARKNYYVQM